MNPFIVYAQSGDVGIPQPPSSNQIGSCQLQGWLFNFWLIFFIAVLVTLLILIISMHFSRKISNFSKLLLITYLLILLFNFFLLFFNTVYYISASKICFQKLGMGVSFTSLDCDESKSLFNLIDNVWISLLITFVIYSVTKLKKIRLDFSKTWLLILLFMQCYAFLRLVLAIRFGIHIPGYLISPFDYCGSIFDPRPLWH